MSKAFSARFSILGAGPTGQPNEFDVFGDVIDQSLDGYYVGDVAADDRFYDENILTGAHTRYKVTSVVATGAGAFVGATATSIHLQAVFEDSGTPDPSGPAAGNGVICRTTSLGISEMPAFTIQGVSEAIIHRMRNIDMRQVVDPEIVAASGGGGGGLDFVPEYHTITAGEASTKQFTLNNIPEDPTEVLVDIINGGPQEQNVDYTITGNVFSWSGKNLDGILSEGDRVRLLYFS